MLGDREKERSIYASDVYQTVLKHPFYIFSPISFKYFDSLKNCIGQVLFQSLYPRIFLLPSHIGATTKFSPCSTKKSPPKIEKNGRGPPGIYLTLSIANKRRKIIGKLTLLRGVGSQLSRWTISRYLRWGQNSTLPSDKKALCCCGLCSNATQSSPLMEVLYR